MVGTEEDKMVVVVMVMGDEVPVMTIPVEDKMVVLAIMMVVEEAVV